MTDRQPLLHSPPFPGIDPAVAAVCLPGQPRPYEEGIGLALGAGMAAARVGGCFWGPPSPATLRLRAGDLANGCDPWPAIAAAERVDGDPGHPVTLLALAAGKPVFDPTGARIGQAQADRLLHAALCDGLAYRDPWRGTPCEATSAIAALRLWRDLIDRNRTIAAAAGVAWWKRAAIDRFLWRGAVGQVPYAAFGQALDMAGHGAASVAVWPSRVPSGFRERADARAVSLVQMEDGFIRSAGLGSDLLPPLSIVADRSGIYYDPTRPSDIETLLATHGFAPDLRERAGRLRARIVAEGVAKYGHERDTAPVDLPNGRRVVAVAGQVDDDRSVALGGAGIRGNAELLTRVRAVEPDAFIVYRPHPDVEAGHRRGAVPDQVALRHVDAVMRGGSLMRLIERVDAVHVLSSLTGFEALLRGREVVVHGQPFYAGWGLTKDVGSPMPRRDRTLDLDDLVAATLILYPRYLDPLTGLPCPPEVVLDHLHVAARRRPALTVRLRRAQGRLRRMLQKAYVAR